MLSARKHPLFAVSVISTDAAMIVAGFSVAYWIRFPSGIIPALKGIPDFHEYFQAMLTVLPIYLFIFRSYRLYQPERHIRRIYELLSVIKAVTLASVFTMALTFIYREFSYSRMVLFFAWLLSAFFCVLGRYILIQCEYYIRREKDRHRVVIVGITPSTTKLVEWSKENPHYGHEIVGILSTNGKEQGEQAGGVAVIGTLFDFNAVLDSHHVDEIIVADPSLSKEAVTEIMLKCENKMIGFKLVADFYGLITHYVDVEYVSNVPLLGLKASPLDDPWNRYVKRLFDLICSFFLLMVLSPLFLILSVLIKAASNGPIFYVQERVGRDQKHFMLYKFRTMLSDAEKTTGPVWAKQEDSRVTPIGKFLRKSNLDELPQLWNVFIGDMSLVGPRPERPHFVEQFRGQIPRYMTRHKIKSGLTGWAQIHGLRGNTSLDERIKYDLYYMENWTLMMDIEILLATLFAFKNAY